MENLYQQFIREKQYLLSVSPHTVEGYRWAWKAMEPALKGKPQVTKADVLARVAELRSQGLSAVTINTYLRSVNAFCHWMAQEGHCPTVLKFPRLKEEKKVLQTFSETQISRLVSFRPQTISEQRIHTLVCLILDTGVRIDEALSVERGQDIDLDELLVTVRHGKGGKERHVPISLQMRKILFRYMGLHKPDYGDLLFFAGKGERLVQRNALRDFKLVCKRLSIDGVRCSFHTLRHTFGVNYVRNGGDVFRLQRILGHSKLDMTRRYVNLNTKDLQDVHQRFSALVSGSGARR